MVLDLAVRHVGQVKFGKAVRSSRSTTRFETTDGIAPLVEMLMSATSKGEQGR